MEYLAFLAAFQGLPAILAGMQTLYPDVIFIDIPVAIFNSDPYFKWSEIMKKYAMQVAANERNP